MRDRRERALNRAEGSLKERQLVVRHSADNWASVPVPGPRYETCAKLDTVIDAIKDAVQNTPPTDRLPLRLDPSLRALVRMASGEVEVREDATSGLPSLRSALSRAQSEPLSLRVRVHSKAGIALASAVCRLGPGDTALDTPPLEALAMEGYAHLKPEARLGVLRRVWSRRAYVTLTLE